MLEKDDIIENLTKELECSNSNEVLNTKALSEKDEIIESLNKEIESLKSEKESVESNLNKVIEEMTKTLEEKDCIINENQILIDGLKKQTSKKSASKKVNKDSNKDDIKSISVKHYNFGKTTEEVKDAFIRYIEALYKDAPFESDDYKLSSWDDAKAESGISEKAANPGVSKIAPAAINAPNFFICKTPFNKKF